MTDPIADALALIDQATTAVAAADVNLATSTAALTEAAAILAAVTPPPPPPPVKVVPSGLADRKAAFNLPHCAIAITRDVTWAVLEPSPGQYEPAPLEAIIAQARELDMKVILRVVGGVSAPDHVKAASGGALDLLDRETGRRMSQARTWTPQYLAATAQLLGWLGDRYDQNPTVVGVSWSFVVEKHGEPMITWQVPENLAVYQAAGYTWAAHRANMVASAGLIAEMFPHTPLVATFNVLSRGDGVKVPFEDTELLIGDVVSTALADGAPHVNAQNHGLGRPHTTATGGLTPHGRLWQALQRVRALYVNGEVSLSGQTTTSDRLLTEGGHTTKLEGMQWCIDTATAMGFRFVELPHDVLSYASDMDLARWADQLTGDVPVPPPPEQDQELKDVALVVAGVTADGGYSGGVYYFAHPLSSTLGARWAAAVGRLGGVAATKSDGNLKATGLPDFGAGNLGNCTATIPPAVRENPEVWHLYVGELVELEGSAEGKVFDSTCSGWITELSTWLSVAVGLTSVEVRGSGREVWVGEADFEWFDACPVLSWARVPGGQR